MGRKILAIVTAMVAAVGIIWIAYMIATIFPPMPPVNLEYAREGDMAAYMRTYPTLAFVAVAVGYAIAAFAGGFIATKMGRRWSQGATLALVVGALLSAGSLATATVWPQPIWFVIVSLVIFVPLSLVSMTRRPASASTVNDSVMRPLLWRYAWSMMLSSVSCAASCTPIAVLSSPASSQPIQSPTTFR